jgi:hypothetical protein
MTSIGIGAPVPSSSSATADSEVTRSSGSPFHVSSLFRGWCRCRQRSTLAEASSSEATDWCIPMVGAASSHPIPRGCDASAQSAAQRSLDTCCISTAGASAAAPSHRIPRAVDTASRRPVRGQRRTSAVRLPGPAHSAAQRSLGPLTWFPAALRPPMARGRVKGKRRLGICFLFGNTETLPTISRWQKSVIYLVL